MVTFLSIDDVVACNVIVTKVLVTKKFLLGDRGAAENENHSQWVYVNHKPADNVISIYPYYIVKIYHACRSNEYYYLTVTHAYDTRICTTIVRNYRADS